MTTRNTDPRIWEQWRGYNVIDRHGDKVGSVEQIWTDRETHEATWMSVKTGLFGMKESFIPLSLVNSSAGGTDLQVNLEKDEIKDAPRIDAEGYLSRDDERLLYEHYGQTYHPYERGYRDGGFQDRGDTREESESMTAVSEEPNVERREENVRLVKHRWTENVPVTKERVEVESDPRERR